MSADPERQVRVELNETPQGGATIADYSGVPSQVTFAPGETAKSFVVEAADDNVDDDGERVLIALDAAALPDRVSPGANSSTTVNISDGDLPRVTVSFDQAQRTVAEGNVTSVTVSLSDPPERQVSIPLTITRLDGASESDFTLSARQLVFAANQTQVSFTVSAIDDTVDDDGERIRIALGTPSDAQVAVGSPPQTTILIDDNDDPEVRVRFSNASYTISEGESGTIVALLDLDPERRVEVRLTVTPVDAANTDFEIDWPDAANPQRVVFESGVTRRSLSFRALADDEDDDGETVAISINPPTAAGVSLGTPSATTVTIAEPAAGSIQRRRRCGGGGGAPSVPAPSEADFDWNVTRDIEQLAAEHDQPTGVWSDGHTVWILDNAPSGEDRALAYDMETGEHLAASDFDLDRATASPPRHLVERRHGLGRRLGPGQVVRLRPGHGRSAGARRPDAARREPQPRGIWSDGMTIYVLDAVEQALFSYSLSDDKFQARFELHAHNRSPRGIWSDGTTIWVSDDEAKRVFAYRIEGPDLLRLEAEEFSFRPLLKAGNSEPRGIWSSGEILYVADEQDRRVYSYNMPDEKIAILSSLEISGVRFGAFSPDVLDYEGLLLNGATRSVVDAQPVHAGATIRIAPDDADADAANGHQAELQDGVTVSVTVTSADASRQRTYTVQLGDCLSGLSDGRLSTVRFQGGSVEELMSCLRKLDLSAAYHLRHGAWTALFP